MKNIIIAFSILFLLLTACQVEDDEPAGPVSGFNVSLSAVSAEASADERISLVKVTVKDEFDSVLGEVGLNKTGDGWNGNFSLSAEGKLTFVFNAFQDEGTVLYSGEAKRVSLPGSGSDKVRVMLLPAFKSITEFGFYAITGTSAGRNTRVNEFVIAEPQYYVASTTGLSISSDSGNTWRTYTPQTDMGVTTSTSNSVAVVRLGGTTIYAGTAGGLAYSADGGTTWGLFTFGATTTDLLSVQSLYVRTRSGTTTLYVGTPGAIHVSTNSGTTWSTSNTSCSIRNFYVESNVIWAAGSTGILKSTDSAVSWTHFSPFVYGSYAANYINFITRWDNRLVLGSNAGICYPDDHLSHWTLQDTASGLGGAIVRMLERSATGKTVCAATSGGLSLSTTGGQEWFNITAGLTEGTSLYMISLSDNDNDGKTDTIWAGGSNSLSRYIFN